ncbi:MAG: hypothetical protein ACTHOG_12830 [Marmoricola sp.]|jgi:hypothetical protein
MVTQVSSNTAHRVERAVRAAYTDELRKGRSPQIIPNYITAPGKPCWAITWHDGPEDWPADFINNLPVDQIPDDVFLEAHAGGVLAVFPFSEYNAGEQE